MKIRICNLCGNEFELKKPSNRCRPCINKLSTEKRKAEIEERKAAGLYRGAHGRPPDLDGQDYEQRFEQWRLRRKHLDTLMERTQWQILFYDEFDRILNDTELWRSLTRPTLAEDVYGMKKLKRNGKIGRPPGASNNKNYPDTRNVNIDDISNYRMGED